MIKQRKIPDCAKGKSNWTTTHKQGANQYKVHKKCIAREGYLYVLDLCLLVGLFFFHGSHNRRFGWWRHLTTTTRVLGIFSFYHCNQCNCYLNPTVIRNLNNKRTNEMNSGSCSLMTTCKCAIQVSTFSYLHKIQLDWNLWVETSRTQGEYWTMQPCT